MSKLKNKNDWIKHVKQYQKQHNVSYKEAMKSAKATYGKGLGASKINPYQQGEDDEDRKKIERLQQVMKQNDVLRKKIHPNKKNSPTRNIYFGNSK